MSARCAGLQRLGVQGKPRAEGMMYAVCRGFRGRLADIWLEGLDLKSGENQYASCEYKTPVTTTRSRGDPHGLTEAYKGRLRVAHGSIYGLEGAG